MQPSFKCSQVPQVLGFPSPASPKAPALPNTPRRQHRGTLSARQQPKSFLGMQKESTRRSTRPRLGLRIPESIFSATSQRTSGKTSGVLGQGASAAGFPLAFTCMLWCVHELTKETNEKPVTWLLSPSPSWWERKASVDRPFWNQLYTHPTGPCGPPGSHFSLGLSGDCARCSVPPQWGPQSQSWSLCFPGTAHTPLLSWAWFSLFSNVHG